MPITVANNINLYYEVHGKGEPLVVINGLGIELSEFEVLTRPLAEKYKVLTFDNRGAGRSDKPDIPYTIDMFAKDTAGLMQATGFNKSNVMGISLGGRIALELTLQHPEMVRKLILVSTGARVQHSWMRSLLTNPLLRLLSRDKYPQPRYAFMRQREASSTYDATARLGEIKAPTLIMHGERDKVAPYELAEVMSNGIKASKLETFRGGHIFFLIRERQRFLTRIAQFLT